MCKFTYKIYLITYVGPVISSSYPRSSPKFKILQNNLELKSEITTQETEKKRKGKR
jgi:hypothetical protein